MLFSLPSSWDDCPEWWQNLVEKIEKEANKWGITPNDIEWSKFLRKKLRAEDVYYDFDSGIVSFKNEEDYLVIKLKYGI